MRLFIAIPLPKDVHRAVIDVQEELRRNSTSGRFVPAGNHHITLRFIGESNALSDIAEAMHEAVRDSRSFLLRLGLLGNFSHGGARTSYISVTGNMDELFRIHQTLETALWEHGFVRGRGRMEPHITLGRAVEHPDPLRIYVPNTPFVVHSIVLYESRMEHGKLVYLPIHTESF